MGQGIFDMDFYPIISITPADKYPKFVIPAQAGIQQNTGCRSKIPSLAGIKSGMTELAI